MTLKLTKVNCPKCNAQLVSKQREEDLLFLCDCGTIHTRDPEPQVIEYDIAKQRDAANPNRFYIPFWRVSAFVRVYDTDVVGGFFALTNLFGGGGGQTQGDIDVYVPAAKMPAQEFRKWATMLTNRPPAYTKEKDFGGVWRMPCNISNEEARKMADFVILTNEAEKPGTMQSIRYDMTINKMMVVFLPFIRDQNGYLQIYL